MEFGIEYVAILIAICEAAKEFGVRTKGGTIAVSLVTAMALTFGLEFLPEYTALVLRGLMLGLAAPGLYRLTKRTGSAILERIGNGNGAPIGHG